MIIQQISSTNSLTTFDPATISNLATILTDHHQAIANKIDPRTIQKDPVTGKNIPGTGKRSAMAKNYDSSINALYDYMKTTGRVLPDFKTLEAWRDDMLSGLNGQTTRTGDPYAQRTVNARLSAVRKWLRNSAKDITDLTIKQTLRDWASVEDAKPDNKRADDDKTTDDYGLRLTLHQVNDLMTTFDTSNLQGLRDRAIVGLMVGHGLRVSETTKLTMRDVFLTENDKGQPVINIRKSKHGKDRVIPWRSKDDKYIKFVESYTDAIGMTPLTDPDAAIFRGLKRTKGKGYASDGKKLSVRGAIRAVERIDTVATGLPVINAHDLRRTYAKICIDTGMSWEALRDNLGHADLKTTQTYVGKTTDLSHRIAQW